LDTDALNKLAELKASLASITTPIPQPLAMPRFVSPAESAYTRMVDYIKDFESELDSQHEVGARLVSFGGFEFHIEDMGYYGPDIISFSGVNLKGEPVQLVQHISQLNVLLMALKKRGDSATRIGFVLDRKLNDPEKA
jgi:hypothetical protein